MSAGAELLLLLLLLLLLFWRMKEEEEPVETRLRILLSVEVRL